MADKKKGYIPLWRDIQDHWLWKSEEPFDDRSAWIDLLLSVNHEDRKLKVGNTIITIHAGQMWTSYKKLANRWNWSRPRVYRYTKMLKSDGMIFIDATPNGTLLTVVNYGNFSITRNTNVTTDVTTDVTTPITTDVTTGVTQTITNNNYKNDKELKEKRREPAPPNDGGEWQ